MGKAYDVVSFGETMLRLSPPVGSRLEEARSFQSHVAGTESNTLACLSRLGLTCAWISALPANPLGLHVATVLRSHGVDVDAVLWVEGARLGTYYAEESQPPLGLQVFYDRAHSACAEIDPDRVDLSLLDHARALHLTGITPAISANGHEVFRRFLHAAKERHLPLSFDVNFRAKLWSAAEAAAALEEACRAADILFCARGDAADLWGLIGDPESILRGLAGRFGRTGTCQVTVLTLGREGAAQLQEEQYDHVPAFACEGDVRFGSGDAFAAGYLYAHLRSPDGRLNPLRFGNAVAALKRCIAGDIAVVTLDEVLALLQREEGARFR
jgi:2-dehydro-3-deoxygluconokinase